MLDVVYKRTIKRDLLIFMPEKFLLFNLDAQCFVLKKKKIFDRFTAFFFSLKFTVH